MHYIQVSNDPLIIHARPTSHIFVFNFGTELKHFYLDPNPHPNPPPPPPPTLAPKQSLSPSFFVFFLVFNHSRSYVCFWLTLQSTSYIPPSHPRPFTKQRKVHQAKVTRIHLTKRIRNLKERETGAILSLILPWCNPMSALTLPLKHLLFVTIYKIYHFFELFSFSIHRSRYTACRYHLRYRDPKVYN